MCSFYRLFLPRFDNMLFVCLTAVKAQYINRLPVEWKSLQRIFSWWWWIVSRKYFLNIIWLFPKKLYAAGKEYFKILFCNTYVRTLPVPEMCEEPLQAHHTISSTSTVLKDLSFFCKPIGRVENPEENVRGLVVMKQHPSSVWQPVTSCVLLPSWHCKCNFLRPPVKDFHIAWSDEKKGDARWKTSPCKFTAASSVPPTGQSTTLPAFMAHRWKVNCNTLKGIWAD